MNAKTTLALLLLAGVAGVWLWKGDVWGPKVGITPAHPEPPPSPTATTLDALTPAAVSRIEVAFPSGDPLVIERAATDSGWKLPGNWPLRKPEVEELVETLGTLHTRFQALPLAEGADLAPYGLTPDQKPLIVKLTANGQMVTLTFGDPKLSAGETAFTRPAFVRVNDAQEVLRLGPDVMPIVRRPADSYRRRQLFTDVERVRLAGTSSAPAMPGMPPAEGDAPATVAIPGENTETIRVTSPVPAFGVAPLIPLSGTFTLARVGKLPEPAIYTKGGEPVVPPERLADAWALTAPRRDHVEPGRLRSVLTAVADLWVDQFVTPAEAESAMDVRLAVARHLAIPSTFESVPGLAARLAPLPLDVRIGVASAERAVTVRRKGSDPVTVRFGGIAKIAEREEMIAIPGGPPGSPPQMIPRKVPTEYRYARVDGDTQTFLVSTEKFADLFATVGQLTDPLVARFSADEVQEVVIRPVGKPEVKLTRKKGNPKATSPADRADRWFLDAKPNPLLADSGRVTELLRHFAGFRASDPDRTRYVGDVPADDAIITLATREKRAEGEPDAPTHVFTLHVGKPVAVKWSLPVRLEGWPRVTLVDDRLGNDDPDSWIGSVVFPNLLSGLIERPPLTYRGRKLFDTVDVSLNAVTLTAESGGFALSQGSTGDWKLTAPISSEADPGKAAQLATSLSNLEATEYLTDNPTADQLKAFVLDRPKQVVTLGFTGGRSYKIELGAPRAGKPEVYARLDGGGVFALSATLLDQLTTGVVGLLPLRIYAAAPDRVTSLEITRTADVARESFTLTKDGTNWKLTGPFAATVPFLNAQPLLTAVGTLQAVKYQALSVASAAEFGLDKPLLRIKIAFTEKKPAPPGSPPVDVDQAVSKTVIVGGLTPDGTGRYAMLDAPNAPVFVVPGDYVAVAQTKPLDLLDRSLLFLDPNRIVRVRIAPLNPADAFALIKNEKGTWSAEGISFAVDPERIAQLTIAAARPSVVRLAAYGDAIKWSDFGLEKPSTTITVTLGGEKPETHAIALGNVDPAGAQFIRVDDGKAVGVIPAPAADTLARKKFEYADRTLLAFNAATLTGFTRKQGKDELELVPAAAIGWDLVKPAKHKADQTFVDELADVLSRLRAEKVVGYGKKDELFKQFGLESPVASIVLTVGDKAEQKTLRLGNPVDPAKPEGDRYVAAESPNPEVIVGVLPATLANKLLAKPVAFRDRTLGTFVDADRATLDRGDRKITFAKVGSTWKVTEPLMTTAESGELDNLIGYLGLLRADTWVDVKTADLKPYGLDRPEGKWTLSYGDKTVLVLLLGKKTADGRVYVTTDKSDLVGLLDPLRTSVVLAEYRQRQPWEVDAAQVEAVEIAHGSTKFGLQKTGPAWIDSARPTDPIDVRAVNELLGTLAALKVDRYVADKDANLTLFGLEKPEATLTVTVQGGGKRVLEIGAAVGGTDGKQRYARVVDKGRSDVFVLAAIDTMRLMRDRTVYAMKK